MHDYLLLFLNVKWMEELLGTKGGKDWLHYSYILLSFIYYLFIYSEEPNRENEENNLGQNWFVFQTTDLLQILTQTQR